MKNRRLPRGRDVAREASGRYELAVTRLHVGGDLDVADPTVLGPHARFAIVDRLAARQAREDVLDRLVVDGKLADVVPDHLFGGTTVELCLGTVDVANDAVLIHAVDGDGSVAHEVFEVFARGACLLL